MKASLGCFLITFTICLGMALLGGCPRTGTSGGSGDTDPNDPPPPNPPSPPANNDPPPPNPPSPPANNDPQKEPISVSVLSNVAVYHIPRDRFYEDDKSELAEEASQTVVRALISRILGVSGWFGIISGTIFNTIDVGSPTRIAITESIGDTRRTRLDRNSEILPTLTYDTGTEMLYWNGLTLRVDAFECERSWNTIIDPPGWLPSDCTDYRYSELFSTTIDLLSPAEAQSLESEFSWGDFVNVIVPLESIWVFTNVERRHLAKTVFEYRFVLLDGNGAELATEGFEP